MKNLKWMTVAAMLLVALTMGLAACGDSEDSQPTEVVVVPSDTPVPKPTDTPPPPPTNTPPPPAEEPTPEGEDATEPASGDEDFALGGLGQPENLDSFRSKMILTWQGTTAEGAEVSESMMIAVDFQREPSAQHVTISGNFPGMEDLGLAEDEVLEMYVVEDMMYMNLFGSWIQAPAEDGGLGVEDMAFLVTDDLLADLEGTNYEGTTTYNGLDVKHYSFDETSFSAANMPEGMDVEEASGNLYIAVDGTYLVHMDMVVSGSNLELPTGEDEVRLQDGSMEITVDLSDINQPVDIVLPEEAVAAGEPPEDIPVPDNAEDLQIVNFMGMITFYSPQPPEEVADYYIAEMPNNGWTEVSLDQMAGTHSLEYSKDARTASILITSDTESGKTSVLISTAEGE